MDKLIAQLEDIAEGDPWRVRTLLREYIKNLKRIRDEKIKSGGASEED